jgi:hypothetical protein
MTGWSFSSYDCQPYAMLNKSFNKLIFKNKAVKMNKNQDIAGDVYQRLE